MRFYGIVVLVVFYCTRTLAYPALSSDTAANCAFRFVELNEKLHRPIDIRLIEIYSAKNILLNNERRLLFGLLKTKAA